MCGSTLGSSWRRKRVTVKVVMSIKSKARPVCVIFLRGRCHNHRMRNQKQRLKKMKLKRK